MSPHLIFHHLKDDVSVESTQEEARRLLRERQRNVGSAWKSKNQALAVLADIQLHGRGTQGRKWERGTGASQHQTDGNLYLTVCLPLEQIPVTLTLLPLQIGVLVAEHISRLINACNSGKSGDTGASSSPPLAKVTVKWPNDVLVNNQKISGTLIENETIQIDESDGGGSVHQLWMLVGIGVNVASAPRSLANSPGKQVRSACCIQDFCSSSRLPRSTALALGQDLASALADWAFSNDSDKDNSSKVDREQQIRNRWISYANFGQEYELRGQTVDDENGGYEGERVVTLGLEPDGQLRVRGRDGRERKLIADYTF